MNINFNYRLDNNQTLYINSVNGIIDGRDLPWDFRQKYCSNVKRLVLSDDTLVIADSSFAYYDSLTSVELPENLERIGSFAFYGSRFDSITIPYSVKKIGACAFRRNNEEITLKEVVLFQGSPIASLDKQHIRMLFGTDAKIILKNHHNINETKKSIIQPGKNVRKKQLNR